MSQTNPSSIPVTCAIGSPIRKLLQLAPGLIIALLAGCTSIGPYTGQPGPTGNPVPVIADQPEPEPPPSTAVASVSEPAAPSPAPVVVRPPRVLVLRSGEADNYTEVAAALATNFASDFELVSVALATDSETQTASIGDGDWSAVVAIGLDAALYATDHIDAPTIFCQILDYEPLLLNDPEIFGVEPMPPLDLQLQGWKSLEPGARSVGMIVHDGRTAIVEEARAAATALGLDLHAAFAATDRDAIYQFKRFAQSVDALWLQPDSQILSPTAIREMLDYALDHGVRTLVFNKALLEWGALLSVGSSTEDVAATVASSLRTIIRNPNAEISRMSPLSAVDLQINPAVAAKLGLPDSVAAIDPPELVSARGDDN